MCTVWESEITTALREDYCQEHQNCTTQELDAGQAMQLYEVYNKQWYQLELSTGRACCIKHCKQCRNDLCYVEDVCWLCAKTYPFYIKILCIPGSWYLQGSRSLSTANTRKWLQKAQSRHWSGGNRSSYWLEQRLFWEQEVVVSDHTVFHCP